MKFSDKKKAYIQLQDPEHLCCDRELLEKKYPKSTALTTGMVDRAKAQREVLWALLDVATVEEIASHRKPAVKTPEELNRLIALISAPVPDTKVTIKETDDAVCALLDIIEKAEFELSDELKDNVSAFKGLLSEALIQIREAEAETERIITIQKLSTLDLEAATQPELAKIARTLKLPPNPDYKAVTLRPQLDAYRLNLPKVSEGSGEEMIPVTAHLETVNELTEENEQLKGELEEKELENEDLQEQLDDAEAEKELLEEQLEDEKKSEEQADQA